MLKGVYTLLLLLLLYFMRSKTSSSSCLYLQQTLYSNIFNVDFYVTRIRVGKNLRPLSFRQIQVRCVCVWREPVYDIHVTFLGCAVGNQISALLRFQGKTGAVVVSPQVPALFAEVGAFLKITDMFFIFTVIFSFILRKRTVVDIVFFYKALKTPSM